MKQNKREKRNKKKVFILLLCILVITVSGFFIIDNVLSLIRWDSDNKETKKITKKIEQEINKDIIDFDNLLSINPDVVAYIKVSGTKIDTVIVQTTDNDYYIYHDLYKNNNNAGTVFMDYENSLEPLSHNTILYGHARLDHSMFGSLSLVFEDAWFNKGNYNLEFITKDKKYTGEIFSVYESEANDEYITTNFESNEAFSSFVQRIKNRSLRNFNVDVNGDSKIITLSTCSSNNEEFYRYVVHAKLSEIPN